MTTTYATGTVTLGEKTPDPDVPDLLAHLRRWEEKADAMGRETVEARLDAWQARIEALRIQTHMARLDARNDGVAPLARVEARLEHAREQLRELGRETSDVWTVLVEAYESARAELAAASLLVEERRT